MHTVKNLIILILRHIICINSDMRQGNTPYQHLDQNDWTVSHNITCDDVS